MKPTKQFWPPSYTEKIDPMLGHSHATKTEPMIAPGTGS